MAVVPAELDVYKRQIQRIEASGKQINGGDIAGSVMQRDMETIRSTIECIDLSPIHI